MSFKVTIIRNIDGATAEVTDGDTRDEGSEFRWTEGNDACDCNRARQFLLARGEEDPEKDCICGKAPADCKCWNHPCGDTKYSVRLPPITEAMKANRI